MKKNKLICNTIITIIVATFSLLMIMPFLFNISSAFKRPGDIFVYPIKWIPDYWYPNNFLHILKKDNSVFLMYYNSIKITAICVLGATLTSSLAAYAYAKMKFLGRDLFFFVMLATIMIPGQLTYIPKFAFFSWMRIMDTHWTLILPGLTAVFGTFLLKQFFMQIPNELLESADVDGAGEFRKWLQIVMPIAKPALATFIITVFNYNWNDYEAPLIFLRSKHLSTLPLGLVIFADESGLNYSYVMAYTSLTIVPILIVFLLGQKHFVKGLTAGAIKG